MGISKLIILTIYSYRINVLENQISIFFMSIATTELKTNQELYNLLQTRTSFLKAYILGFNKLVEKSNAGALSTTDLTLFDAGLKSYQASVHSKKVSMLKVTSINLKFTYPAFHLDGENPVLIYKGHTLPGEIVDMILTTIQKSGSVFGGTINSNEFSFNNQVEISENKFMVAGYSYDFYKLPYKVKDCSKIDYDTTPYPFDEATLTNNATAFIEEANNRINSIVEEYTTYSTEVFAENMGTLQSCLANEGFHPDL